MRYNLMKFFLLCCGLIFFSFSYGQRSSYTSQYQVGILSYGPFFKDAGFTLESFHGVEFNNRFALGSTVGLDSYRIEGDEQYWILPISAKLVTDLSLNPNTRLSLGVDGGYGFAGLNKEKVENQRKVSYEGGFMLQPFAGLKFKANKKHFWSVSLGYKRQHFTVIEEMRWPGGIGNDEYGSKYTTAYTLQRLVVKAGWGF
jgi:hypothetical protein